MTTVITLISSQTNEPASFDDYDITLFGDVTYLFDPAIQTGARLDVTPEFQGSIPIHAFSVDLLGTAAGAVEALIFADGLPEPLAEDADVSAYNDWFQAAGSATVRFADIEMLGNPDAEGHYALDIDFDLLQAPTVREFITEFDEDRLRALDPTVNGAAIGPELPDEKWRGTAGNDIETGTDADDLMTALAGNDKVRGAAGDDVIFGGAGRDRLFGGSGDDEISGQAGRDKVKGNSGDDDLAGGRGIDKLIGGSGNDILRGGGGKDILKGGAGNDIIHLSHGEDTADGGAGSDTFIFSADKSNGIDRIILAADDVLIAEGFAAGTALNVRQDAGSDVVELLIDEQIVAIIETDLDVDQVLDLFGF